jgi:hypothetical protein
MTTPIIVTKSPKSLGVAILLAFLFGPIGLFYASVFGGFVMTITPIFLILFIFAGFIHGNALLFGLSIGLWLVFASSFWLLNIIWAIISVGDYNKEIEEDARKQNDFWAKHYASTPNQVVVNINQNSSKANTSWRQTFETSAKPHIQDWLKSNPGKTINDYFAKFGR